MLARLIWHLAIKGKQDVTLGVQHQLSPESKEHYVALASLHQQCYQFKLHHAAIP